MEMFLIFRIGKRAVAVLAILSLLVFFIAVVLDWWGTALAALVVFILLPISQIAEDIASSG